MLEFNKILLPIDLEEPDLEMVHQTSVLAHHFHSEILILHVIQPLSSLLGFSDTLHGNLRVNRNGIQLGSNSLLCQLVT